MKEYINIGSAPFEEECAQVGRDGYREQAKRECEQFIIGLKQKFGEEPEGASLRIKWFPHGFGSYAEVVCYYDTDNEQAANYAFKCEEGFGTWDEVGMKAPKNDDPAFTESELIPVPDKIESVCRQFRLNDDFGVPCKNVMYDAKTIHGPWADMTEESFAKHGICELGLGKGQKYMKATDGNWYKVEG